MLEQILKDMYIDPDLLAELSEDQRQLLFIKMREEQVKRWNDWDEKIEMEQRRKSKKSPKSGKKKVGFLTASDGNEWVWVMGEHPKDRSIEIILEEEAQQKALKQAEFEAEQLRKKQEMELKKKLKEEEDRLQREILEKEAEIKRKAEEAALYQSIKEARLASQKLEEEKRRQEEEEKVQIRKLHEKMNQQRLLSINTIEKQKNRKSNELYVKWKEIRRDLEKTALEDSKVIEKSWLAQEQKSKEAEHQRKILAMQAREQHRASLTKVHTAVSTVNAFKSNVQNGREKPALPPKRNIQNRVSLRKPIERPLRPETRQSVVNWFRDEERGKKCGIDERTGKIAVWFHGIISRDIAENILFTKDIGAFLVRVSEKVWGYTISYRSKDRCKHFLVDMSEGTYQFFGNHQMSHQTLNDLISYHMQNPITKPGNEVLLHPCGQETDPPDYWELYHGGRSESTCL